MKQQHEVFDTVGVTVPVPAGAMFDDAYHRSHLNRETGELGSRPVSSRANLAGGLPVKVVAPYGQSRLKFEVSIPGSIGKGPLELATADEVWNLLDQVLDEALDLLEVAATGPPHISRVDVARQFEVPTDLASGVAAVGQVLGITVFRDRKTGGTTVTGGSKERTFRLYDKTSEAGLAPVAGLLTWRFEVQLRQRAAAAAGLADPKALDPEKALSAARRVFDRHGLGGVVGGSALQLRAAIERGLAAGVRNVEQVIGYAVLREIGVPTTKHRSTAAKYERTRRQLELPPLFTAGVPAFRLDWDAAVAIRDLTEVPDLMTFATAVEADEVGSRKSEKTSHANSPEWPACQEDVLPPPGTPRGRGRR